jgi:hypothetical protein
MWADNKEWLPKVLSGEEVNAIFLYGDDKKVIEYRFDEVSK